MSLQDITNKILSDARAEAEKILQANKVKIEKVAAQKDKEITEAVQAIEKKGKEKEAKLKEQAEFQARMIEKNAILKVKQELIDQVFAMVKKRLAQLDDATFVKLTVAILKDTPQLDGAEVITSSDKKNLMTKAIKEAGLSYKISKKHLPRGQEGFILSSKTMEVNCTIDNLVESKKEELGGEVTGTLFD